MKKIDAHAHALSANSPIRIRRSDGTLLPNCEELLKVYNEMDIESGILMPLSSPEGQSVIVTNESVLEMTQLYPNRFYWCCNIDPRMVDNSPATDFSRVLSEYKKNNAIGVGEITADLPLMDPMVQNLLCHCSECSMPVTIHWADIPGKSTCYGIDGGDRLADLVQTLKNFPKLAIIGHSVPFWELLSTYDGIETTPVLVKMMRAYPNLYCDTSANSGYNALSNNMEFTCMFLSEFQDRILFGLDISFVGESLYKKTCSLFDSALNSGMISPTVYEKICFKNALRLYGLN